MLCHSDRAQRAEESVFVSRFLLIFNIGCQAFYKKRGVETSSRFHLDPCLLSICFCGHNREPTSWPTPSPSRKAVSHLSPSLVATRTAIANHLLVDQRNDWGVRGVSTPRAGVWGRQPPTNKRKFLNHQTIEETKKTPHDTCLWPNFPVSIYHHFMNQHPLSVRANHRPSRTRHCTGPGGEEIGRAHV